MIDGNETDIPGTYTENVFRNEKVKVPSNPQFSQANLSPSASSPISKSNPLYSAAPYFSKNNTNPQVRINKMVNNHSVN